MNAIEIKGLKKEYKDFSLGELDLILPQGCIMGLIGENGAGKSTAIRLMLDMIKKDGGEIKILGKDNTRSFGSTKEDIGVVLDEVGISACLTPIKLGKILKHTYKNWDDELYKSYLERFSLPPKKKFKEFSKGMKMKLGIAAALSHHPKLLILDEATSGLDPVIRDEMLDIFSEFTRKEDHSILISSHIVSDLEKICDYIAFLHKGKLMLCEEKDILKEQYGIIRCTKEQASQLNPKAIIGKKVNPYGVEIMVRRDSIPTGTEISNVDIEQLFIFMTKEANAK